MSFSPKKQIRNNGRDLIETTNNLIIISWKRAMRAKIMVLRHVINRRGKIKLYRKLAFLIRKNWTLSIPQWRRFIFIKNSPERFGVLLFT